MDIFTQQQQQLQIQQVVDSANRSHQQAVDLNNALHQHAVNANFTYQQLLDVAPTVICVNDQGTEVSFDDINAEIEARHNAHVIEADTSNFDQSVEEVNKDYIKRAAQMSRHFELMAKNIKSSLTDEELAELEQLTKAIFE